MFLPHIDVSPPVSLSLPLLPFLCVSVIDGKQVLAVSSGKHSPETHMGGWGSVVNFIDDVKLIH